jgi:cytochrome c553
MALAAAALATLDASAQTPLPPGEELRPLYAMGSDLAEGKQLAETACAKCHGADGLSVKEGVPHLAGQRPSYLYLELRAYQAGARSDKDMTQSVKFLSDAALVEVAAYYASLDPAAPPQTPAPRFEDPLALGKAAAAPCAKCHGENGISQKAGAPSLIGQTPKYLAQAMKAYVSGDRPLDEKNAKMKDALTALSDKDIERVALYYAVKSEGLARAATPIADQSKASKESVARCVKCHGEDGVGTAPANPSLAGQDYAYIVAALHAYKDKSRDDDVMGPRAAKLDDADMSSLAAYYASLPPKPSNALAPLSADEWADKCDRCHGVGGNSVRPTVPSLASQRMDYLDKALRAYRAGARTSLEMAAMSSILSDDDIAGIAAHYAWRKARPAVFVLVPTPAK